MARRLTDRPVHTPCTKPNEGAIMHKVTFYPLGNAESCLVKLDDGEMLLFDYADVTDLDAEDDNRIDLEAELKTELEDEGRNCFDVVAFTHLDQDHISGATEFFYLEHAERYQEEDRVEIGTLWVPAAAIVEEGLTGEARTLRQEARHRLREGHSIRVFSRPERLSDWLADQGLSLGDREHLISDAGEVVPEYQLATDDFEVFVHSPFAVHADDGEMIDRNIGALVLQANFQCDGRLTRFLITSDIDYEAISDIVAITRYHDRPERLYWDIGDVPHHCSYTALSPEKGTERTDPIDEVAWLWEEQQADRGAILVSSSKPVPDEDTEEPPHRQAAAYYQDIVPEFAVTMEHPDESDPHPTVIEICSTGATLKRAWASGVAAVTDTETPRAGEVNGQ